MRIFRQRRNQGEEEESVFVTMTDMTISFLLIVMILLAFFATLLNNNDSVSHSEHEQVLTDLREANISISGIEALLFERTAERDLYMERLESLQGNNDTVPLTVHEQIQESLHDAKMNIALLESSLADRTSERDALRERLELVIESDETVARALHEKVQEELRSALAEISLRRAELAIRTAQRNELQEKLEQRRQVNPLEVYLADAIKQRRKILVELRDGLRAEFPNIKVTISPQDDALRFQGEGLFESGSSDLKPRQRLIVTAMGRLLDKILACYTLGERASRRPECDSGNALIEAVQIEGHTDDVNTHEFNLNLSTKRANETLRVIMGEDHRILAHKNRRDQPVMSVSGYGKMRPIVSNETAQGKASNRRIDLRIIMDFPITVKEVNEINRIVDAVRLGEPM